VTLVWLLVVWSSDGPRADAHHVAVARPLVVWLSHGCASCGLRASARQVALAWLLVLRPSCGHSSHGPHAAARHIVLTPLVTQLLWSLCGRSLCSPHATVTPLLIMQPSHCCLSCSCSHTTTCVEPPRCWGVGLAVVDASLWLEGGTIRI